MPSLLSALAVAAGLSLAVHILATPVQEPGILEGSVTIGPLCPVEPCHVPPEVLARAYEARKILVRAGGSSSTVRILDLDAEGHFLTSLPPGTYTVDINRIGIDRSSDVPKTVVLKPGERVHLETDIDTGIR